MDEEILSRVKAVVVGALRAKMDLGSIAAPTRLDSLGLDSLNIVDVLLGLEEEFALNIDDDEVDLETFATFESITEYVRSKLC